MTQFNGKEIKFVMTQGFAGDYNDVVTADFIRVALSVLKKHPVDMLVFETKNGKMDVRLAGYDFTTNELDEETVAFSCESIPRDTFWLKLDDQGDFYSATFLYPSEW
jgi:hypothetical protein